MHDINGQGYPVGMKNLRRDPVNGLGGLAVTFCHSKLMYLITLNVPNVYLMLKAIELIALACIYRIDRNADLEARGKPLKPLKPKGRGGGCGGGSLKPKPGKPTPAKSLQKK